MQVKFDVVCGGQSTYIYSGYIEVECNQCWEKIKEKGKGWIAFYVLIVFLLIFYGLMKNCNVDTRCQYE